MNYVKNNLKFLRKKEALTQEQLATKIGVKRAMIGAYEEGRAEPRLHTLQHLAAYFQVRLDDFVNKDLSGGGSIPKADVSGAQLRILPVVVDGTDEAFTGTKVPNSFSSVPSTTTGRMRNCAPLTSALGIDPPPERSLFTKSSKRTWKYAARCCKVCNLGSALPSS